MKIRHFGFLANPCEADNLSVSANSSVKVRSR